MRFCTKCDAVKPVEEFYVRDNGRVESRCKVCVRAASSRWHAANRDVANARRTAWTRANPEREAERNVAWKKANPGKVAAIQAVWVANHPEEHAANCRAWKQANAGRVTASTRRRQAAQLKATPAWANEFFIEEAYALAQLRTRIMGYEWHVDHIVPLRSKIVCGLHVEHNLRVIPAVSNLAKGNRHWPDMP